MIGQKDAKQSNVRVVGRIRPFLKHEVDKICCLSTEDDEKIVLTKPELRLSKDVKNSWLFKLDRAYPQTSTQEELYTHEADDRLGNLFQNKNTTIMTHGITGTGKTFTMSGEMKSEENWGLIPRSLTKVFQLHQEETAKLEEGIKFRIYLSFMEIYKEKVYDLLAEGKFETRTDLALRDDEHRNVVVAGLREIEITSVEQFMELFEKGNSIRATSCTNLNKHSSRSHSILQIRNYVEKTTTSGKVKKKLFGKLNLIDLAGSEDNRQTGNKGKKLAESNAINKSLFVLGKVINALNQKQQRIPYRDSKLTRLLQDSLGGTNYTTIIVTLSPCSKFMLQSYNSLSYATKSREIVNRQVIDETNDENIFDDKENDIFGFGPDEDEEGDSKAKKFATPQDERRARLAEWKRKRAAEYIRKKRKESKLKINKNSGISKSYEKKRWGEFDLSKGVIIGGKPFQTSEKKNRQPLNEASWMVNGDSFEGNSMDIDERAKEIFPSPIFSKNIEASTKRRVSNIEKKLAQISMNTGTNRDIPEDCKPFSLSLKQAKRLILEAKMYESHYDMRRALEFYQRAFEFMPDNKKLREKIQELSTLGVDSNGSNSSQDVFNSFNSEGVSSPQRNMILNGGLNSQH